MHRILKMNKTETQRYFHPIKSISDYSALLLSAPIGALLSYIQITVFGSLVPNEQTLIGLFIWKHQFCGWEFFWMPADRIKIFVDFILKNVVSFGLFVPFAKCFYFSCVIPFIVQHEKILLLSWMLYKSVSLCNPWLQNVSLDTQQ